MRKLGQRAVRTSAPVSSVGRLLKGQCPQPGGNIENLHNLYYATRPSLCGRSSWESYTCYGGGGPRAGKITIRHGGALKNIIRTISFVNGNMGGRGCRFGLSMFPPHVGRHKGSGQATRPPQKTRSLGVEWTRTYAVPPTRVRLPRYLGKMGPQSGWVARRSCQALRSWELDPAPSEITRHVIFRHLPPAAPTTHWLGASTRKSRICSQEHDDQRKC